MKRAKDPSDIHWVNKGVRRRYRLLRFTIFVIFAILINIIVVYGHFVSSLDWVQYFHFLKRAPGINCDSVRSQFGDNLANMAYVDFRYAELSKFPDDFSFG